MAQKKISKKVLIVDYGSKSAQNLKDMYEKHPEVLKQQHPDLPGVEYKIDVVPEKGILSLKKEQIRKYNIVHHGGARTSKNISNESARHLMDNAHQDAHVVGSCYGAQVIADYHGVKAKKLSEYQKGKQEINYKGEKRYIHKAHQWGIPITGESESKLESIAHSEQKFHEGGKGKIYEVYRAKNNPKHIGIQGHGEQGVGKEIMYDTLNTIHKESYQQNNVTKFPGKKHKGKETNYDSGQQEYVRTGTDG